MAQSRFVALLGNAKHFHTVAQCVCSALVFWQREVMYNISIWLPSLSLVERRITHPYGGAVWLRRIGFVGELGTVKSRSNGFQGTNKFYLL